MNIDEQIKKLDERLTRLETNHNEIEKETISNKYELAALIKEAVLDGNRESIKMFEKIDLKFEKKFNELEQRTCSLETAEARSLLERKKEITKIIISTVIGFVLLGILSNGISIISEAINISNQNKQESNEVIKK